MSRVFTDYVSSLDPAGEPPGVESVEEVLAALGRVVRRELRSRGLWESPPAYLGVYGSARWAAAPGESDALQELVAACYSYVFVRRLRNLLVHLGNKPSIDGLVLLSVRNFLFEAQKKHDPLGYRVFQVLLAAVEGAVEAGELYVLAGDRRIRNDTVLGFRADADPRDLPAVELREAAVRWNEELLPGLVTARGEALQRTVADLRSHVAGLSREGVEGFRFKELVDPLKNDARSRWAARLELEEGETAVEGGDEEAPEVVKLVPPDTGVEERESFEKLVDCVAERLERLEETERTRDYLARLWAFLQSRAGADRGELPSRRRTAELLDIPRNRMGELFGVLGELLRSCREASFARAAVNPGGGIAASTGRGAMRRESVIETLRRQTAEARRRHADTETELRGRGVGGPRPGDLYLVAGSGDLPVEWALVEPHPEDPRRFLAVAADAGPLVGSADVAVPEEASCAPLTLRCASTVWLGAGDCDSGMRTGTLPPDVLAEARSKRRALAAGSLAASDHEREVDADPGYRAWISEVPEAARSRLEDRRVVAFRPRRRARLGGPLAIAASILLATTLGLGGVVAWQERRIAELRKPGPGEPVINLPFETMVPLEPARSGPETIVLPSGAELYMLIFNVAGLDSYESYRLELRRLGEAPEEVWKSDELRRTGATSLSVAFPTRLVPAGDYRFRLYGLPDGPERPLAEYAARFEHEEE